MHNAMPPLTALRAFEAAARHLSLTKAAEELHVTAGALSHQIRGLEESLGVQLFERRVRSIALTAAGKLLYPGLQTGFTQIRDAVANLGKLGNDRVLVISTPPGLTSKWLAPRLYRFANANPNIDARISSSLTNSNFTTDGVDVAVRNLSLTPARDPALVIERLVELAFIPVCSPQFLAEHGPLDSPQALAHAPLIHDDTLVGRANIATWEDWFKAAGVKADVSRGLRFNSADHALDAAGEGAGMLLTHDLLAYDDLRTGRLVIPIRLPLRSERGYFFVCPTNRQENPHVQAFRAWINQEIAALDWTPIHGARRARAAG